jgi:DNA-directed RNA polymerase subunit F
MTKPKIISETPISMAEAKSEIEKVKKRDSELNFRSTRTEEYLNVFAKLSKSKADELKEKLEKLKIPRLGQEHIIKVIDILPQTGDELKVVLQGYPLTITKENMQKIVNAVKEFA